MGARLLLAGALFVSMGTALNAQERGARQSRTVFERDRLNMHPGEPLQMLGIAEADEDFHAGTPTLQSSNGVVARVDLDALYERQIGLASGGVFYAPPMAAGAYEMSARGHEQSDSEIVPQATAEPASTEPSESEWPLGTRSALVVALTAVVAVFLGRHLRGAGG